MKFPFTPVVQYTAIALAYQNKQLIADMVLPRTPVVAREFRWDLFNRDDSFTIPSTLVGRKGKPNEVEFGAIEQTSSVLDYALKFSVPYVDVQAAQGKPAIDPISHHVLQTTDLIMLDREVRVAGVVFNDNTYPSENVKTLSGESQWSDYKNSHPVADILDAKQSMIMAPNTLVLGSRVFYTLQRHPEIIATLYPTGGNAANGGLATLEMLKALFGLDNILVGEAYLNTSKRGHKSTLNRVWGNHAALLRISPIANVRGTDISFGMTAQYGDRGVFTWQDPDIGSIGGLYGKVVESVKEVITAPDCGFMFKNAVSQS